MQLAFTLLDWHARAPGLSTTEQWLNWSALPATIDAALPLAKCSQLPMMAARRLNEGSRAAVDCGLELLHRHSVDAVVFTSRHGELERNLRILTALAQQQTPSPTDFTMSVHNAAVGSLTIAAAAPLVATSLSAGIDSFQQGLVEVAALHAAGYQQVMLVDFDGAIPAVYRPHVSDQTLHAPYAVALLLAAGDHCSCYGQPLSSPRWAALPQSLQFLHARLAGQKRFCVTGERVSWQWECRDE
ncbi:beta-ketoacyl synthase chain length factor [Erwinia sp. B116]|uniref:beta-ketoacyl synthase chain length factor n=1 Tax=Erwinia sp. B116 TaxID=1561024 RepID=UPI000C790F76|nr:beta-ketoacyl synthase chain length factor [Erwinia sp. B116]PLV62111.1 beta-ketoacyl synthase, N-terminal domain protein [Erwinia sp. B116]